MLSKFLHLYALLYTWSLTYILHIRCIIYIALTTIACKCLYSKYSITLIIVNGISYTPAI